MFTESIDAMASPELGKLRGASALIPFGSDEHWELWSAAARLLAEQLREADLLARTAVLNVPWAEIAFNGQPTPASAGVISAADAHRLYPGYHALLTELGFTTIEPDPELVYADPAHRGGLAPFHYMGALYRDLLQRIQEQFGLELPLPR